MQDREYSNEMKINAIKYVLQIDQEREVVEKAVVSNPRVRVITHEILKSIRRCASSRENAIFVKKARCVRVCKSSKSIDQAATAEKATISRHQ